MTGSHCDTPGLMDIESARAQILAHAKHIDTETIPLTEANGRVLAEPLTAQIDSPGFDTAMMDGYAINSSDLNPDEATVLPVTQRIAAGDSAKALRRKSAARIFTGAPVPPGADTVVMQEQCNEGGNRVTLPPEIRVKDNILRRGENFRTGDTLCFAGLRLEPSHLGLAAGQGIEQIAVYRQPTVALINSGNELVMPGRPLQEGQIYNSNYFTVRALLEKCGCQVFSIDILADSPEQTRSTLQQAADSADIVITTGGVSVGEEDHIRSAVETLGQLQLWRVRIKPGKPFAFGQIGDTPFIGLPGNPVSCFITFCLLARPYLLACQGMETVTPDRLVVHADFENDRPDKRDTFRCAVLERGEKLTARLVPNQNSASLLPLLQGDGLVHIPAFLKVGQGTTLDFYPFSELI
jgi:molybdopterin molybdotransferase